MKFSFFSRTKVIIFCILMFSLVLMAKLFFVQIVHSAMYKDRADHQYTTPASDVFERGTIYFSDKDGGLVSAAIQVAGYKVAINPTQITNAETVYQKLSNVILDKVKFLAQATKKGDPYEEVAHHLTKAQADEITKQKITGVTLYKEKWRFYPGDNLASNTIGFLGYQGNDLAGRYGLERQYENTLSRGADNPYVNFFAEVFSNISKTFSSSANQKKGDIITTIEPSVQDFLDKKLDAVKQLYNPETVGGIIMNPQDGSIYAMSVNPNFNLNDFSKVKATKTFANPLVENVLEFGSVVKPLVMASALDTGAVTAQTTYDDKGSVIVEKHEIFNFDKRGRGPGTSMQEVLNQSLNTGMVFVEQHLGRKPMKDYMLAYGIKDKTGIDLPNETSGLVSNLNSPREIEFANASFGQGIALTPIEFVRALASLSNGGNLVVPHVVKAIRYDTGLEKTMTYDTKRGKISVATSQEITRMMVGVMDSIGAGAAKLPHYSVAAKTGTAQVADYATGGYYSDRYTHSFVGFFPAYDPKFIVFLYAVNPKGVQYSATTWTQPFVDITKFLLNYYEVSPDR